MSRYKLSFTPSFKILKELSRPLGIEIGVSVIVALFVYAALFYKRYFSVWSGGGPGSDQYLQTIINNFFASIDRLSFTGSASNVILWCIVGVVIYLLVTTLVNILISIKNTSFEVSLNPDRKVRLVIVAYELRRSVWIILTLLYLYAYVLGLRYLLLRFNHDVTAGNWIGIMLGVLGLSLGNYLLYAAVNLVIHNPLFVSLNDSSQTQIK